jgi:hypothetical protein
MGPVVAGEPDLVHAVVEADDAVFRHNLADIVDDTLGCNRETILLGAVIKPIQNSTAQLEHPLIAG